MTTEKNLAKQLGMNWSCFTCIENIQYLNEKAGYHFFDKSALRFFNSKVLDAIYSTWKEECTTFLFITSEKGPDHIRKYSVRSFDSKTGKVDTVNDFQAYETARQAHNACKALVKAMKEEQNNG